MDGSCCAVSECRLSSLSFPIVASDHLPPERATGSSSTAVLASWLYSKAYTSAGLIAPPNWTVEGVSKSSKGPQGLSKVFVSGILS